MAEKSEGLDGRRADSGESPRSHTSGAVDRAAVENRLFDETLASRGKRLLRPGDVLVAVGFLALALVCALWLGRVPASTVERMDAGGDDGAPVSGTMTEGLREGADADDAATRLYAVVQNADGYYEVLPLDVDATLTVAGPLGTNVIEVRDGRVRVAEADCSNQVCVDTGWVWGEGSMVVCLPHRLTVEVVADPADAVPLV